MIDVLGFSLTYLQFAIYAGIFLAAWIAFSFVKSVL
jgi:hypothetical protein